MTNCDCVFQMHNVFDIARNRSQSLPLYYFCFYLPLPPNLFLILLPSSSKSVCRGYDFHTNDSPRIPNHEYTHSRIRTHTKSTHSHDMPTVLITDDELLFLVSCLTIAEPKICHKFTRLWNFTLHIFYILHNSESRSPSHYNTFPPQIYA